MLESSENRDRKALLPHARELLARVELTLVIWGEKDTALLPQNLEGLDQFVPHLTVKRIPDGFPPGDPREER